MWSSKVLCLSTFVALFAIFSQVHSHQLKMTCGFPGSPKNGRVMNLLEKYDEGQQVTFECEPGYYLLGPMTRTCRANGTWSGPMPFCEFPMKPLGATTASENLNDYPAHLAVDGNKRTCFFNNRRTPRWWRVELPEKARRNRSIVSVALTFPPVTAELHFSVYVIEMDTSSKGEEDIAEIDMSKIKYHKCATFQGVFSSSAILVECPQGVNGLHGNYLQIEDEHVPLSYFGLCEVDIFVREERHDCGQVEIPVNGFMVDKQTGETKVAEYTCREGFRLVGSQIRTCNTKTGQWAGEEPYCEHVTCESPSPIANGYYRVFNDYQNVPVLGTRVVYECLPGYNLVGENDTRVCETSGAWTGERQPHCDPIDCNHPESLLINPEDFMVAGAHFRLVNGTTKYSTVAELVCPESTSSPATSFVVHFRCREDGIWIDSRNATTHNKTSSCIKQRPSGLFHFVGGNRNARGRRVWYASPNFFLFVLVVSTALVLVVLLVILFIQKGLINPPSMSCGSLSGSGAGQRFKAIGQSIGQSIRTSFASLSSNVRSFSLPKSTGSSSQTSASTEPAFTITSASTLTSDVEMARGGQAEENKAELNTALATFYEEITNATKQVYSADTDRKLMRAARIAAELDAIKFNQQESNYHWIYGAPPQVTTNAGGSHSLPASLPPSVYDTSYQALPSNSQVYAKVDLIRKHRYRKEKETSVYQVPRPVHYDPSTGSFLASGAATLSRSSLAHQYQLRKALSVPEAVFLAENNYATVRQYPNYSNVNTTTATTPNMTQTLRRNIPHLVQSPPKSVGPILSPLSPPPGVLSTSKPFSPLLSPLSPPPTTMSITNNNTAQPLQIQTSFTPLRTLL